LENIPWLLVDLRLEASQILKLERTLAGVFVIFSRIYHKLIAGSKLQNLRNLKTGRRSGFYSRRRRF